MFILMRKTNYRDFLCQFKQKKTSKHKKPFVLLYLAHYDEKNTFFDQKEMFFLNFSKYDLKNRKTLVQLYVAYFLRKTLF